MSWPHWCMLQVWYDHMRIRAAALRNAYSDLNSETGKSVKLVIGAPTLSQPRYSGSLGEASCVQHVHSECPAHFTKPIAASSFSEAASPVQFIFLGNHVH